MQGIALKLIMVIFVHFIQRYSVCSRESINILQFTPSFLFSFFNIAFWTRLLKYVFTSFAVFHPIILLHGKFAI